MRGLGKALLWVGLAAVVAVALVVGYAVYQLSNLYPDEAAGERLEQQIEDGLADQHPQFRTQVSADRSFGEVTVRLTTAQDLADVDVPGLLAFLEDTAAKHEGSSWSVRSELTGEWDGSTVSIRGHDTGAWGEMSGVFGLPDLGNQEVGLALDRRVASLSRTTEAELHCGAPVEELLVGTIDRATTAVHELGWDTADDPGLTVTVRGCDDTVRLTLQPLPGEHDTVLGELRQLVLDLPEGAAPGQLLLEEDGALLVHQDGGADDASRETWARWSHGAVQLNGEVLAAP